MVKDNAYSNKLQQKEVISDTYYRNLILSFIFIDEFFRREEENIVIDDAGDEKLFEDFKKTLDEKGEIEDLEHILEVLKHVSMETLLELIKSALVETKTLEKAVLGSLVKGVQHKITDLDTELNVNLSLLFWLIRERMLRFIPDMKAEDNSDISQPAEKHEINPNMKIEDFEEQISNLNNKELDTMLFSFLELVLLAMQNIGNEEQNDL